MQRTIVDCSTGITTIEDLTPGEIAEIETQQAAHQQQVREQAAIEEKRQQDKESGNQKLKDLGLTDDEIAAITS